MNAFDEREMVFQRIVMHDPNGNAKSDCSFHICRFFGERACWIDAKVLHPKTRASICSIPGVCRDAEFNGVALKIVSVDWLLEHCHHTATRAWLEGMSTVFDHGDNSKGQMKGKTIYRNP